MQTVSEKSQEVTKPDVQKTAEPSYGVRNALEPSDLERLAAEGAALPLADAIAYALEERDPFASG